MPRTGDDAQSTSHQQVEKACSRSLLHRHALHTLHVPASATHALPGKSSCHIPRAFRVGKVRRENPAQETSGQVARGCRWAAPLSSDTCRLHMANGKGRCRGRTREVREMWNQCGGRTRRTERSGMKKRKMKIKGGEE